MPWRSACVRCWPPARRAVPAYLRERARDVEVVPAPLRRDLGVARRAEPDVILGSKEGQGRLYPSLRKIAPTIMTDGGGAAWELSVRLRRAGANQRRRAAAGRLGPARGGARRGAGWRVKRRYPSCWSRRGRSSPPERSRFRARCSSTWGSRDHLRRTARESEMISRGQLGALDGDVILLSVAPECDPRGQRLQSSRAWRRLSRCAPAALPGGSRHLVDGWRHPGGPGRR